MKIKNRGASLCFFIFSVANSQNLQHIASAQCGYIARTAYIAPCSRHIAHRSPIVFRGTSGGRPLQDGRFVNRPYRFASLPHRRGRRFQTPQSGVLPLVALTPKGVRYLDDPPPPRFNKSKTVCIVILEQSEGSADGFLHFLLSIIFYLFSII